LPVLRFRAKFYSTSKQSDSKNNNQTLGVLICIEYQYAIHPTAVARHAERVELAACWWKDRDTGTVVAGTSDFWRNGQEASQ
jgi:hypothetical protein